MNKSKTIIDYYMYINRLKEKLRSGFVEMEIAKERTESVAEHTFGCLMLAIAIDSEYKLNLDTYKVMRMLTLHELEEILMPDYTVRAKITPLEKRERGRKNVHEVVQGLMKKEEIEALLEEFNERATKEAKFCYHIDKIENDMQAKVYDLQGTFAMEKALEDLPYYGEEGKGLAEKATCASDIWLLFDSPLYDDDPIFKDLIEELIHYQQTD